MRLILFVAILLPAVALCQSKKSYPVFGKVDKADLQQTSCDFDKDAEAMVIFESAKLFFDFTNNGLYKELQHTVRIKILNDNGLKWANVKLRYESRLNAQSIMGLTANTYNLDASGNIVVTKLDKKQVYQKKINALMSEEVFILPEVKVGSIIEYKYTWRGYGNRNWNLQATIPVKFSTYVIDFPSEFEVHNRPYCSLPFSSKDESTNSRTIKSFTMENIPALRDEEYISCKYDYLQRVESYIVAYTYEGKRHPFIKSWTEVSKSLMEDDEFGTQLKKEIPRTIELDNELKKLSDPYLKMISVHNYVRKNMKWDGVDNFWASSGVKAAWKDKSGTSGEINLILINLLRDAGLKVDPIMVSTRSNGRISSSFPNIYQFNKVLAFVDINGKNYVLDGTDKLTPAGLIPENIMFTEGMILDPYNQNNFRWHELWDEAHLNKNTIIFQAAINADGEMKGHATVTSQDYARLERLPEIKNGEKFLEHFYSVKRNGFSVDSLKLKNQDSDSLPLVQDFDFHGLINASGGYSYFTTNLFSGMGSNPFISDTRFSDVFFGTNQTHQIIAQVKIPDGYTFEELPKNIRISLEDKSLVVTRMTASAGNIISTRMTLEFKRPFYTPEEYPDLKEFYKKMYALLDEQIVIKKKENM
jgi:hypothetical protein